MSSVNSARAPADSLLLRAPWDSPAQRKDCTLGFPTERPRCSEIPSAGPLLSCLSSLLFTLHARLLLGGQRAQGQEELAHRPLAGVWGRAASPQRERQLQTEPPVHASSRKRSSFFSHHIFTCCYFLTGSIAQAQRIGSRFSSSPFIVVVKSILRWKSASNLFVIAPGFSLL